MASAVAPGIALAAAGFSLSRIASSTAAKTLLTRVASAWNRAGYYRGGFQKTMDRREAALVLGVSPNSAGQRVKDAHRKLALANHPDRGGSPLLAAKVNEARDLLLRRR